MFVFFPCLVQDDYSSRLIPSISWNVQHTKHVTRLPIFCNNHFMPICFFFLLFTLAISYKMKRFSKNLAKTYGSESCNRFGFPVWVSHNRQRLSVWKLQLAWVWWLYSLDCQPSHTQWVYHDFCLNFNEIMLPLATKPSHSHVSRVSEYSLSL